MGRRHSAKDIYKNVFPVYGENFLSRLHLDSETGHKNDRNWKTMTNRLPSENCGRNGFKTGSKNDRIPKTGEERRLVDTASARYRNRGSGTSEHGQISSP